MALRNRAEIFDVDESKLVADIRDRAAGPVFCVVEYDVDRYNALFIDDAMRDFYQDDEQMFGHFDRIHSYIHVDFAEMDLFTDTLFPVADRVEYLVTTLDFLKLVRVYADDRGLFLTLGVDEPVEPVIDVINDYL